MACQEVDTLKTACAVRGALAAAVEETQHGLQPALDVREAQALQSPDCARECCCSLQVL